MAAPTFYTKQLFNGECSGCGRRFTSRNSMGLAAQHYDRCGGRISLEVMTTFVWEDSAGLNERAQQKEDAAST